VFSSTAVVAVYTALSAYVLAEHRLVQLVSAQKGRTLTAKELP